MLEMQEKAQDRQAELDSIRANMEVIQSEKKFK